MIEATCGTTEFLERSERITRRRTSCAQNPFGCLVQTRRSDAGLRNEQARNDVLGSANEKGPEAKNALERAAEETVCLDGSSLLAVRRSVSHHRNERCTGTGTVVRVDEAASHRH